METELSIEIDRPIAQVFEHATSNVTEWSVTCVEDEVIQETPEGVGSTFRLVTEEKGRKMEFQGVVTRYEAPKLSAVHLTGDQFDLDVEYALEDLGERTRLTQKSAVHGKGFVKPMLFLFGWLMKKSGCKAQENELESLKRYCEARPA